MRVRMSTILVELSMPVLTDTDRGLEVGASRVLFDLKIPGAHARRIVERFRERSSAQVVYRSLAGEEFNTEQQFADVREVRRRYATPAAVER